MRRGSGTRRRGCSTRASFRGRAVLTALLVSAAAIGVGPAVAAASAASLKLSVTTQPAQGAFTVTASGSTDPYNTSTNKAPELTLYIVDPAAPTTSCQATAVIEQSSSSNTAVFAGETLSNPGPFSFNNTQAPGDGRYFLCGYVTAITANGGSGGTEAMASAPVTIAPVGTPTPSSGKRHRPTRAQRLSAALKKCAKLKRHSTRAACVRKAKRLYGAKHH
jgi:hypothetical protein